MSRTTTPQAGTSRVLLGLAAIAFVVAFLNFLWFFEESSTIGDASRGYVRDGRYFLVHAGRATEVTRDRFQWSQVHAASLIVTHPLGMAGAAYLMFTVGFPAMVGASRTSEARARVERIRASGPSLARTRTGGRLGELRLTRPLMGVAVHPGGIVLDPVGLAPIGIEASAVVDLHPSRSFLSGRVIEVHHRQSDSPSVHLLLGADDPVVTALRRVAAGSMRPEGAVGPSDEPDGTAGQRQPYSREMKGLILGGMALSIVFAVVSIPFGLGLGSFGDLWSVGVVGIIAFNAWTYLVRNRDRW